MGGIYTIAIVVKIKYISSVDIYISIHSLEYTHALMFPWDISGLQYPASLLYTLCCHQSNDLLSIGHFILHNLSRKVITDRYRPGCWCRARERMAKECSLHHVNCSRPDCNCRQQIMQREIARVVRVLAWLLASLIVIIQLTSVHRYHRQSPVLGLSMQSRVQLLAALANKFLWMGSIMQP